jgi:chemotaxis protein methyltransferase CheR
MRVADDQEAIEFIISLIYERSGIRLHEGKQHLIRARLGKRLRHHGMTDLAEYCHLLRRQTGEDEITQVVDALTTNFTNFLREEDHFKFLVNQALPSLLAGGPKQFRIWSAACASGEEPYSIAFYLAEHFPPVGGWDWRILATDISTKALSKGEQAVYPEERCATLSQDWLHKYFQKGQKAWQGHYRIKPSLAERVTFKQINLLADYDFSTTFAVIFCRNVMIYFDRPTQEHLVNKLSRHLMPQGFLLVGHAESLTGLSVPLRCLRPSIYQKI